MRRTSISPGQREGAKTPEEQAEDIAYTINHALACTATDALEPYLDNWFQKKLGIHFPLGCGHDHGKRLQPAEHAHSHEGQACGHDHHHHDHHDSKEKSAPQGNLWRWYAGELAGDFGAVPITVAAQRYAPSFMHGLRQAMEPALGPVFRAGARWSARSWVKRNGIGVDSEECREKQRQIYEHEVSHLPQALLWTASSIAINLCTQRLLGNQGSLWQIGTAKAMGASLNTALVVGGRAFAPQAARSWDQFTSRNVFLPATKAVGRVFGIEEDTVQRMAEKQALARNGSWEKRVQDTPPEPSRVKS